MNTFQPHWTKVTPRVAAVFQSGDLHLGKSRKRFDQVLVRIHKAYFPTSTEWTPVEPGRIWHPGGSDLYRVTFVDNSV